MKKIILLSSVLVVIAFAITEVSCKRQNQSSTTFLQNSETIFSIGIEDKADREFLNSGWDGKEDYVCQVGMDYRDDRFPAELHIRGAHEAYGVVRLKIVFGMGRSHKKMILRLVRGGDETTVIKVDGGRTYEVTSTMLGSGEGFRVGSYELNIGALEKGEHSIEFTVAEDGKGNGAYQWDAIKLFGI